MGMPQGPSTIVNGYVAASARVRSSAASGSLHNGPLVTSGHACRSGKLANSGRSCRSRTECSACSSSRQHGPLSNSERSCRSCTDCCAASGSRQHLSAPQILHRLLCRLRVLAFCQVGTSRSCTDCSAASGPPQHGPLASSGRARRSCTDGSADSGFLDTTGCLIEDVPAHLPTQDVPPDPAQIAAPRAPCQLRTCLQILHRLLCRLRAPPTWAAWQVRTCLQILRRLLCRLRAPPTWAPCQVRTCLQILRRLLCRLRAPAPCQLGACLQILHRSRCRFRVPPTSCQLWTGQVQCPCI